MLLVWPWYSLGDVGIPHQVVCSPTLQRLQRRLEDNLQIMLQREENSKLELGLDEQMSLRCLLRVSGFLSDSHLDLAVFYNSGCS